LSRPLALRRSLVGSLSIHGILLGLAWFVVFHSPWRPELPATSRKANTVQVRLQAGSGRSSSPLQAARKNAPKIAQTQSQPSLNLGLDFSRNVHKAAPSDSTEGSSPETTVGGGHAGLPDGYDTANSMDIKKEAELYPFFRALWRKVDSQLGYPNDFVKERISGYVTAQLVVDRGGVFKGEILGVASDQPYLEAYVLAILFHSLKEPLPRNLWSDREQMILVMHFDFKTFTYGELPPEPKQINLKNVLTFNRGGYTDSRLNEAIQKFMTHYFPPIIPLPGAFYIDFIRAYQLVQNFKNRHKMDEEGLRAERISLSREEWQNVIRSGEKSVE
jgi:hypothetical protein